MKSVTISFMDGTEQKFAGVNPKVSEGVLYLSRSYSLYWAFPLRNIKMWTVSQ